MKYQVSLVALIPLAAGAALVPTPGECPPTPNTVAELDAAAVSNNALASQSYRLELDQKKFLLLE